MSAKKKRNARDDEGSLHSLFEDLVMSPKDQGIVSFCEHAGIVMPSAADAWWPTFLAHYLRPGLKVDLDRAFSDFATWGPIARRVEEIKREQRGDLE